MKYKTDWLPRIFVAVCFCVLIVGIILLIPFTQKGKLEKPKLGPGYYTYRYTQSVIVTNKRQRTVELILNEDKVCNQEGNRNISLALSPKESKYLDLRAGIHSISIWGADYLTTSFDVRGNILLQLKLKKEGVRKEEIFEIGRATVKQIEIGGKIYYFKLTEIWPETPGQLPEHKILAQIEFGETELISSSPMHLIINKGGTEEIILNKEKYQLEFLNILERAEIEEFVGIDIVVSGIKRYYITKLQI